MQSRNWLAYFALSTASLLLTSCSPQEAPAAALAERLLPELTELETPSASGSLGPWLVAPESDHGIYLSWLEPVAAPETDDAAEQGEKSTFAFRMSRLRADGSGWEEPITLDQGRDFWPNWADVSAVARLGDGWVAHRLRTLAEGTYDYGVQLLHSEDGAEWRRGDYLHDDRTPAEHGFVSYVPLADGPEAGVQAFWLDGREMPGGGAMALRTARITPGGIVERAVVDDRVCECCPTSAARTSEGAVVVYRNRSEEEFRDIWIARLVDGEWSEPRPVHEDHWEIAGCPVNGPVVTSDGERTLWVTWYTVAEGTPRIRAALSLDGGETFEAPLELDEGKVLGRIAAVADSRGDGVWATWLTRTSEEGGRLRLAHLRPGSGAFLHDLMPLSASRRSGYPQMVRFGEDGLLLAWTEVGEATRVRTARVEFSAGKQ